MAFSKSDKYNERVKILSFHSKALTHSERLEILESLLEHGPLTVEELTKRSQLSQTAISQHLENLRIRGLVGFCERFPYTHYHVVVERVLVLKGMMDEFFSKFAR